MKNLANKTSVLFSFLAIVFLGCAPDVQTRKTSNVDLSEYNTYAYLPASDTVQYRTLDESMVEEKLMEAINTQMQQIGYSVDKDNPGLLVKTHVMVDQEENLVTDPVYSNYGYYYPGFATTYASPYYYTGYDTVTDVVGYDIDEIEYTEGTVVIDLIDAETNEIVWRGWADERVSPDNFQEDIREYAEEVFDEYPIEEQG